MHRRRFPVPCVDVQWLDDYMASDQNISFHSLGVFLDIFLIIDGHFLNFGRFCYSNQLAVGKLAVICPTWAATFLGFLSVFFSGNLLKAVGNTVVSELQHGGLHSQQLKITKKRQKTHQTAEKKRHTSKSRMKTHQTEKSDTWFKVISLWFSWLSSYSTAIFF